MKKNFNRIVSIVAFSSLLGGMVFAQPAERGRNPQVRLLSAERSMSKVQFRMDNLQLTDVQTAQGVAQVPTFTEGVNISEKGMPTLPILSRSLAVSETRAMKVEVVSSKFIEKKNVLIAPSKGVISRAENPDQIPYVYGQSYNEDKFFPGEIATLSDPFILRDVRGQVVNFAPLQYNPVTKTLRIYTEIVVAVSETAEAGQNAISLVKNSTFTGFEDIYKSVFMNYEATRYTPVEEKENGRMIVIVPQKYKDDIEEFVKWKEQRGLETDVKVAEEIATPITAEAIQKFVKEEYQKEGNNLTYVLLIGDHKDIPAKILPGIKSDQVYGQIVGNDHYNEVFIGRFSCESKEDLKTQIDRTIHYERNITTEDKWLGQALCIASDEGAGGQGDNGESDIQHQNVIANLLTKYGYTKIIKCYDPGVKPQNIIDAFNGGISLANYTGHGSDTFWVTSHFGVQHMKDLTNYNQLPFIFDVACVNGNFLFKTCFAEALMRAQKDGKPKGTVAIIASTINQSWASPMRGQDEMNSILCEQYPSNIKRTFGGVTMNGMFAMVEKYKKDGENMLDTWTVFGDPSLLVRTLVPTEMQVTAPANISPSAQTFEVACDYDGAIATLSDDGDMVGTAKVKDGKAIIKIDEDISDETKLTLTVVGYNKVTVIKEVKVQGTSVANVANDKPYTVAVSGKTITVESPAAELTIFDMNGRRVAAAKNGMVFEAQNGVYAVRIAAEGKTYTEKVIVK